MLLRIWLFGIVLPYVSCALLTGDHICEVEERYPVNITEYSLKNVTVRNYKWCMGFPPRCSFYTVKAVKVPEVVERLQTQIVRKCCPGFVENASRDGCVPCRKCFEGTCGNGGNCLCNSGFRGEDCADACEPLRWGINCQHECLCEHGTCNPRTGRCDCPTGWFGTRCEVPCLEGFYGKHCIKRCSCGERDLCDPETGECLKKPPRQQEHQSTRAIHYMTEDILNLTISMNKQKSTPSLKKYYTFDTELHSRNNTEEENYKITEINTNKKTENREKLTTIPQNGRSSNTNDLSTKTETTKLYGHESKKAYDSAESTTETSAEIIPEIPDVQIIDDNGSLENREQKNSNEKSHDIFETKEINSNFDEENTLESEMNKKEININENLASPEIDDRNLKILKKVSRNLTTDVLGYPRSKKQQFSNNATNNPLVNSENFDVQSSEKNFDKNPKSNKVTTQGEEDNIVLPNYYGPHSVRTTTSKYFVPASNNAKNMEENELQNLDITNIILTSREATTASSRISTTVGMADIVNKGVLPIAEVTPSTKNIEMKNDLLNENQFFMKEAYGEEPIEEDGPDEFEFSANRSDIGTPMSVLAVISFILVLILSGIILVHHYIRRKKTKNKGTKTDNQIHGGHTVSVYTHSIFHTPLPDPPTFQNPVFKTPLEVPNEHGTFQTHVICSLNFPENKVNEKKEYTYDHPPSTGSYRAASIPEPLDIFESPSCEPVYDEIPSTRRANQPISPPPSYKSSCLYMNTCGRTKF